jgi:hypothetical protein
VNANPGIFLSSDWVHPAQLRAFLAGHDALNSTCQATSSIKLEPSRASVFISPQEPHVKTEDLDAPTIDLVSPARASMYSAVRTRYFVENHTEIIEILSSDDEMEVEASLWPSGMSSDPPNPSHFLDHNDSDEDPQDPASVALSTTFWGDANIISRLRDEKFDYVDANGSLCVQIV